MAAPPLRLRRRSTRTTIGPTSGSRTAVLLGALLALLIGAVAAPVAAETPDPSPWGDLAPVAPGIDATAHSLRVAGPTRGQTALSAALLLRGEGTYPFGTADRTSGGAALADASGWWGLGTCPFSVIVTAGDTPADSLAAASLSDPTDGSSEPLLTRSASADPDFDPVGEQARVDTDSAPIVVTTSVRQGATGLSSSARAAVEDLSRGGCTTARAAIVVGGTGAVPTGAEADLLSLGYTEVFRVAGSSRYGTAAAIARALGTGTGVANGDRCADEDATDGGTATAFHGNAVVERWTSPTACELLGRTVVLTDGITGADALAAGWWTSTWQVPVLLVDAAGNLPTATQEILNSLVIDNIVVLGGRARVPDQTVSAAEAATGATATRVAGDDRYATSVEMAGSFGGWFPTGDGADHDGSLVCLAASRGSGAASIGWPDALGAGPWCAAAGGAASATAAPVRGLPPVSGSSPRVSRGLAPSHGMVPVLLVPGNAATLPGSVGELLAGAFDPADTWCSSVQADDACLDPGLVVAFGGTAVLSDDVVVDAARAVSGETYVVLDDRAPSTSTTGPGFFTALDLRPVYGDAGVAEASTTGRLCLPRASVAGVRWLAAFEDASMTGFLASHDLLTRGRYATDADGTARSPGVQAPACLRVAGPTVDAPGGLAGVGTSLSGSTVALAEVAVSEATRLTMSGAVTQTGAEEASGTDSSVDPADGSVTRLTFADGDAGVAVTSRGEVAALTGTGVSLTIVRGATASDPDGFLANLTLTTPAGTVAVSASGEAIFSGGTWRLRGRSSFGDGTWNVASGAGGFTADLVTEQTDATDDVLTWRLDGLVAG